MEMGFVTWDALFDWVSFVAIVLMITQFIKETKYLKKIPTKYISFLIALLLIIFSTVYNNTFTFINIIIYMISAVLVSTQAGGIHDSSKTKSSSQEELAEKK